MVGEVSGRADEFGGVKSTRTAELRRHKVFRQFEGIFATQLAREMQRTAGDSGLFGKMPGAGVYESLVEEVMAGVLSRNGALGIADMLERTWQARYATTPKGRPSGTVSENGVETSDSSRGFADRSAIVRGGQIMGVGDD